MAAIEPAYDLIVIGGGAAGFFGALNFAAARSGSRILILEKAVAVLAKVRISGGGRCNVTHAEFDPARLAENYPRGGQSLLGLFHRFNPADTVQWFSTRNVNMITEADGRMFPASQSSETIIQTFLDEARRHGIRIAVRTLVNQIVRIPGGFRLTSRTGQSWDAQRVLLTTGGDRGGFDLARSVGHQIVPPVPSLFTFQIADPRIQGLSGVSLPAALSLPKFGHGQVGPLLITHWGLSGPAAIKLSAWAARDLFTAQYQADLLINWLPNSSPETIEGLFRHTRTNQPRRIVSAHDPGTGLPHRLWRQITEATLPSRQTWGTLSNQQMIALLDELFRGYFLIRGKAAFKEEFVTAGGVSLSEVDWKTMQSRILPGLFFAGEVLDIDGVTGGFNFQSAWTTAWIAAQGMADYYHPT